MSTIERVSSAVCALLLASCGDLERGGDDGQEVGSEVIAAGGVRTLTLDASGDDGWVYLDLESASATELADATTFPAWDLGFQRFKIKLNGGASGTGSALVSVLREVSFADVTRAPEDGYSADAPDGSDTDLEPDYAISTGASAWYEYNSTTHVLTPRAHVYVVRSAEGTFFKCAVLGYYNSAGSSGYPALTWAPIAPPASALGLLDAGSAPESDAGSAPESDGGVALDASTSATRALAPESGSTSALAKLESAYPASGAMFATGWGAGGFSGAAERARALARDEKQTNEAMAGEVTREVGDRRSR